MWHLNNFFDHRQASGVLFSKEECQNIVRMFDSKVKEATTETKNKNLIRQGKIHWVDINPDTSWIYERCSVAIKDINADMFKYDLDYIETLQFTSYSNTDDRYGKHLDNLHVSGVQRKLSFSVQLSEPHSYEGCELLLHNNNVPTIASKDIGVITIFPSNCLHEVTSLQSGQRYSLVGWVVGPRFK
jgi:hypothetical protein